MQPSVVVQAGQQPVASGGIFCSVKGSWTRRLIWLAGVCNQQAHALHKDAVSVSHPSEQRFALKCIDTIGLLTLNHLGLRLMGNTPETLIVS
jgi:hypothetical protein